MKTIVKPEDKMVIKTGKIDANEIFEEITKGMSAARRAVVRVMLWNKYDKHFDKIRAIAKCSPDDEWNEEFGTKLAEQRFYLKRHERIIKIAQRLQNEFLNLAEVMSWIAFDHAVKSKRIQTDIENYFCANPKTNVSEVRFY